MKKNLFFFIMLFFVQFAINAQTTSYELIGWNDLGMHCANKNFSKIAVLPPYNNIYAQLIKKVTGQEPQIVTSGVTIEYSIPGNTYSVGKTDFWTYAQQLFGLSQPLPPNIGLEGKGLTGTLDVSGNYFYARGIPLTPYPDNSLNTPNNYQLIHLVAKITGTSTILATTDAVIPVSNEIGCVQSGCHSSEQDILNRHEDVTGFNRNGPVLCASCHQDNALGTTGKGEAPPFSQAIHSAHAELNLPNTTETCYKCHPGPQTQCLRGAMVDFPPPSTPMKCEDCHGTLANVGSSVGNGRRPWLDEPNCGTCHGANYAPETGKLFKDSKGHGGLFCSACHGSPHGLWPTHVANDNLQSIRLQGTPGVISKCTACHTTVPTGPGPHGIYASGSNIPPVVSITSPTNGASFSSGTDISISANASDTDGTITNVVFYEDSTLLGTVINPPYTLMWNNVSAGSYTLTAVAKDNQGATTISAGVYIIVNTVETISQPIISIISPENNASFNSGSDITISASVSDKGGQIIKVGFYRDNHLLGYDYTSPYSYMWQNVHAGNYTLKAVATDNEGKEGTSSPVYITVNRKRHSSRDLANYPNPFNPTTRIEFNLESEENVTLTVYNMIGQEVAVLINNKRFSAGVHSVNFNAINQVSGTYICKLQTGSKTEFRKIVLLK